MNLNNLNFFIKIFLIFIGFLSLSFCSEEFCYVNSNCSKENSQSQRFLLYDVNGPEGFNLRRDVYMRFAVFAHKLKYSKQESLNNFKLVLPPWSHLVHWKYSNEAERLPWHTFFNIKSLQLFAPVIEMYDFFAVMNASKAVIIDELFILQHFDDMFETGNFEDRIKIDKCNRKNDINYFFYKNITAKNVKCLSYHGPATKLKGLLEKSTAKVILLHHAEVALHEMFGNKLYWEARRSMRFSDELRSIADEFRKKHLNSLDDLDGTVIPKDYRQEKPKRTAKGGPYLAVHLRRKDFLIGRSEQVPSLQSVIKQISEKLHKLALENVFIATDATHKEYEEIENALKALNFKVFRYKPSTEITKKYSDGGVAIIDQIICSHSRHFIGTYESTFSFRIQEEREILGFPVKSTFNCFCKDESNCPQPSVWKIVF